MLKNHDFFQPYTRVETLFRRSTPNTLIVQLFYNLELVCEQNRQTQQTQQYEATSQ